jgi:hypothetical protein
VLLYVWLPTPQVTVNIMYKMCVGLPEENRASIGVINV